MILLFADEMVAGWMLGGGWGEWGGGENDTHFLRHEKHIELNPLLLKEVIKYPDKFDEIFWAKANFGELFEKEMFIRTLTTTLLQIFCDIILTSLVIVKCIGEPNDNFWRNY